MQKRALMWITVLSCGLLLGGCNSTEQDMQNARFSQASAENAAAVQQALSSFFNGQNIPVSNDVFVDSSELVIDRQRVSNVTGQVINGRDISSGVDGVGTAERFFLKTIEGTCSIMHERTGQLVLVPNVTCEAN
ncbi:hypothetical protein KJ365_13105 [Glaciecola sp. XM2]|uniref:hypothetical protein n=1 Tax=Glaciecola sp. XM2 TaxID=1914931 RepID=UPI001BDF4688|nr:hypothetical protein [Glaciecola sp. XM2]MBT1451824.1 hypothetical protein [Glaciecola sp. XM2]